MRKLLLQLMLSIGLGLSGIQAAAASLSDQLIILSNDGLGYTAQHTLASDGDLMVISLPAERINLNVQFSGPEKNTFAKAHQLNPERLSLWSGNAFTRYRLRQSPLLTQSDAGIHELRLMPGKQLLNIENVDKLSASLTLILPEAFELISFTATDESERDAAGRWSSSGNTLSFESSGKPPAIIAIEYQRRELDSGESDPCLAIITDSDECSPDIDNDQVPDYRDICIGDDETNSAVKAGRADAISTASTLTTEPIATSGKTAERVIPANNVLGCADSSLITLEGVRFQSGQSYLDVRARQVLDRVATALQNAPAQLFEVASHTDNAGRVAHNQRLSENRSDAVRHYLMLRGVGPNQLQARGYGETSPVHDNRLAAGRRANRRVELRRLE